MSFPGFCNRTVSVKTVQTRGPLFQNGYEVKCALHFPPESLEGFDLFAPKWAVAMNEDLTLGVGFSGKHSPQAMGRNRLSLYTCFLQAVSEEPPIIPVQVRRRSYAHGTVRTFFRDSPDIQPYDAVGVR
jgi:hypothetical protein